LAISLPSKRGSRLKYRERLGLSVFPRLTVRGINKTADLLSFWLYFVYFSTLITRFLHYLNSSLLDKQILPHCFIGIQRAFNFEDDQWEAWKSKTLKKWKDEDLLLGLLELE
jgi:hypothetical protein